MRVIGIDPGKSGFLAYLGDAGQVLCWPTPTVPMGRAARREYDVPGMRRVLMQCNADLVVIEQQRPMPKQGVSSTFTTGRGFGIWEGLCSGLGLPYTVVAPTTWQRLLCRDLPGKNPKARSVLAAGRLFPGFDLRRSPQARKPCQDKCDALLIALYGKRVAQGALTKREEAQTGEATLQMERRKGDG